MPGTVYENQTLGPGWVGQEGDIYIGCTILHNSVLGIGSVCDATNLQGGCNYPSCNPYITTMQGCVFGNTIGPCSFSYVQFGPENVLHENYIDGGNNTQGTPGNYGLPGVHKIQKGVIETNSPCELGSDDLPDGVKVEELCVGNTDRVVDDGVERGDRASGGGGGGGGDP